MNSPTDPFIGRRYLFIQLRPLSQDIRHQPMASRLEHRFYSYTTQQQQQYPNIHSPNYALPPSTTILRCSEYSRTSDTPPDAGIHHSATTRLNDETGSEEQSPTDGQSPRRNLFLEFLNIWFWFSFLEPRSGAGAAPTRGYNCLSRIVCSRSQSSGRFVRVARMWTDTSSRPEAQEYY